MQSSAEAHAERLAWHQESWTSIELLIGQGMTLAGGDEAKTLDFDWSEVHYVETAAGQRLHDTRYMNSGKAEYAITYYFDGRRGADVTSVRGDPERQHQIILHQHFGMEDREVASTRPIPFLYYWVDRVPLHEALKEARPLGQGQVIERPCDRFLLSDVGWTGQQDQIYSLDEATSTPLKLEVYRSGEDREKNYPLLVWTAEEIGEFQGYPMVVKATKHSYTGEGGKLSRTNDYRVESVAFNKDFPESIFRPEIQPGVLVMDNIRKTAYSSLSTTAEGAADQESASNANPGPTQATTSTPIRAVPPNWPSHVSMVSIGIGCVLIMIGFVMWWRGKLSQ